MTTPAPNDDAARQPPLDDTPARLGSALPFRGCTPGVRTPGVQPERAGGPPRRPAATLDRPGPAAVRV